MNKRIDPERDLDQLLAPGSGEFGDIYRRLSRPEPPRRLDRIVLAHAARTAHGGRAPAAQRWMLGIGSAAGVVLAAGIAWQVGQQLETQDNSVRSGAERQRSQMIEVQPITEPATPQTAAEAESGPIGVESSAAPAQEKSPPARNPSRKTAPAPAPAPVRPPPPPPADVATPPAEPLAMPERSDALPAETEAQPFLKKEADAVGSSDAMRAERIESRERFVTGEAGALGAKASGSPDAAHSRAPAPTTSVQLRDNMRLAPEQWLAEIVRLKREGHRQQAVENLRLFRRMYPDWQLSDELLRLAE